MKKGSDTSYNGIDADSPIAPPKRRRSFLTPAIWVIAALGLGTGTLVTANYYSGRPASANHAVDLSPRRVTEAAPLAFAAAQVAESSTPPPTPTVTQAATPEVPARPQTPVLPADAGREVPVRQPEPAVATPNPPPTPLVAKAETTEGAARVQTPVAAPKPKTEAPVKPQAPVAVIPNPPPAPAVATAPTPVVPTTAHTQALQPKPVTEIPVKRPVQEVVAQTPPPAPAVAQAKAPVIPPTPVKEQAPETKAPVPPATPAVVTPGPLPAPKAPAFQNTGSESFDYSGIKLSTREPQIQPQEDLRKVPVEVLNKYIPITSRQWRLWVESLGEDRVQQLAKVPTPIRRVFEAQRDAYMAKVIVMTCLKHPQKGGCKTVTRSAMIGYVEIAADYLGQNEKPIARLTELMGIKLSAQAPKVGSVSKGIATPKPKKAASRKRMEKAQEADPTYREHEEEGVYGDSFNKDEEYDELADRYEPSEWPAPRPLEMDVPTVAYPRPINPPPRADDASGWGVPIRPIIVPRSQVRRAIPVFED